MKKLLAVLTLVALVTSVGLAADAQRTVESDAMIRASAATRKALGLPASLEVTAEVLATDAGRASAEAYGFALTADEQADMEVRYELLDDMDRLGRFLRDRHSDIYAAHYLDHKGGGNVVVGLTDTDEISHELLKRFLTYPNRLRVVEMDYAWVEMRKAHEQLVSQLDGADVGIGFDERANTLYVSTETPVPPSVALDARSVGVPVRFDVAPADEPANRIIGGRDSGECAMGIQMQLRTIFGVFYYTTTAAHCDLAVTHHGTELQLETETWDDDHADAQLHWIGGFRNRGRVLDYTWGNTIRINDESRRYQNYDQIGDIICKGGPVTGTTCGTLVERFYHTDYGLGRRDYRDLQIAEGMTVDNGDSGAAVYGFVPFTNNGAAVGIVSGCRGGCPSDRAIYSHISLVLWEFEANGWPVEVLLN